jgi:hypothetical protein
LICEELLSYAPFREKEVRECLRLGCLNFERMITFCINVGGEEFTFIEAKFTVIEEEFL